MSDAQFHLFLLAMMICSTVGVAIAFVVAEIIVRYIDAVAERRRINRVHRAYRESLRKPQPGSAR